MKIHLMLAATALGAVLPVCGADLAATGPADYRDAPHFTRVDYSESGRVVAIDNIREEGHRTSGAGAVIGGIAGGVLGHQIGSGRGNDAATVAGAVGGAVVGNQIEKNRNNDRDHFRVTVRFRDGREEAFAMEDLNGIRVGDRVHVDGGRLYRG